MASVSERGAVAERLEALCLGIETMDMCAAKTKEMIRTLHATDDEYEFAIVIEAVERLFKGYTTSVNRYARAYFEDRKNYLSDDPEQAGIKLDALPLDTKENLA